MRIMSSMLLTNFWNFRPTNKMTLPVLDFGVLQKTKIGCCDSV